MQTDGVILAAGKSSRFKGNLPKFLHPLLGKPILDYVEDRLRPFVNQLFYVVSSDTQVKKDNCIIQQPTLGTGHAVLQALPFLKGRRVLIAYGDTPLISEAVIQKMHKSSEGIAIAVFHTNDLSHPYGRVDPITKKITQYKDASEEDKANSLCHAGIMAVDRMLLNQLLPQVSNRNEANEYYLTDIINLFTGEIAVIEGTKEEFMGIDTRANLAQASQILNRQYIQKHMNAGVTFHSPDTAFVSFDTKIGVDTEIGQHVVFGTNVSIGSNAKILPFCHLENCSIESHCIVGPFARLRGHSTLAEYAEIGNFVEVKQTHIGKKSKAKHHAYLGDAHLGIAVNIGAGTITCNYDGKKKARTILEDGVFVGSNVNLIAPLTVGHDAYIGAGSSISKDVEPETLVVERSTEKRYPRKKEKD